MGNTPSQDPISGRPGPPTPQDHGPSQDRRLGPSGSAGLGAGGCYQQQGKEGQVVAAADGGLGSGLRGAARGRPVSCWAWRGRGRIRGEGREGRGKRGDQRAGEGNKEEGREGRGRAGRALHP